MKVGVALIPSPDTIESIIKLQQKIISICPLYPILYKTFNLPHLTLLQGRFDNSINWLTLILNLQDYWQRQQYSQKYKLIKLEYKSPGWYFLILQQQLIFLELHNFVFSALKNNLFVTEEDLNKDISLYDDLEKNNYIKYGYRYIGNAFYPHITLGQTIDKSRDPNQADWIHLVESFTAKHIIKLERITIYQVGEHGSHAKILYSVKI
ncbi:hypothetical protein A2T98_17770 [Nodularia spumigena CENA596]|uniref:2'-5' RNA ligase n=1 Tax=Nodularia spumigena CENA596 TaxID=1819295 RepID=A0A161XJ32_NODSP|nr:hypothetical protein [Nodularia spumigena]KZL48484.1 hypothetical protein A2T98_17770 [Nodularia spumigena CENA596]